MDDMEMLGHRAGALLRDATERSTETGAALESVLARAALDGARGAQPVTTGSDAAGSRRWSRRDTFVAALVAASAAAAVVGVVAFDWGADDTIRGVDSAASPTAPAANSPSTSPDTIEPTPTSTEVPDTTVPGAALLEPIPGIPANVEILTADHTGIIAYSQGHAERITIEPAVLAVRIDAERIVWQHTDGSIRVTGPSGTVAVVDDGRLQDADTDMILFVRLRDDDHELENLYRVPVAGGEPTLLYPDVPNFAHGRFSIGPIGIVTALSDGGDTRRFLVLDRDGVAHSEIADSLAESAIVDGIEPTGCEVCATTLATSPNTNTVAWSTADGIVVRHDVAGVALFPVDPMAIAWLDVSTDYVLVKRLSDTGRVPVPSVLVDVSSGAQIPIVEAAATLWQDPAQEPQPLQAGDRIGSYVAETLEVAPGCQPPEVTCPSFAHTIDGTLVVYDPASSSLTFEADDQRVVSVTEPLDQTATYLVAMGPDDIAYLVTHTVGAVDPISDLVAVPTSGAAAGTAIERLVAVVDTSGDTDLVQTSEGLVKVSCCAAETRRPALDAALLTPWLTVDGSPVVDDRPQGSIELFDDRVDVVRHDPTGELRWSIADPPGGLRGMPRLAARDDGGVTIVLEAVSADEATRVVSLDADGTVRDEVFERFFPQPEPSGALIVFDSGTFWRLRPAD